MERQRIDLSRLDVGLQEQASRVYEKIGMDLTTAVQCFLMETVWQQRWPISSTADYFGAERVESQKHKSQNINHVECDDLSDEGIVGMMPLQAGRVPPEMYEQLIRKIPQGKISSMEAMAGYLGKLYGVKADENPNLSYGKLMFTQPRVPLWRVVSKYGVLIETIFCTRERQKAMLEEEGIPVVQRGSIEGSFKVENYRDYMFDFSKLRVIKRK